MRNRWAVGLLGFAVSVAGAGVSWAVFPEFQSQNSNVTFLHSGIVTSDNRVVWDFQFAREVNRGIAKGYREISFAFMQCFGGGMIDELQGLGLNPASYTSAARHDQLSWASSIDIRGGADPLYPDFYSFESTYNLHYAPVAGSAPGWRAPQTQRTAANAAYQTDWAGQAAGAWRLTNPQYTSTGAIGDGVTLHRPNPVAPAAAPQYRAILFGGSSQLDGPTTDLHINQLRWLGPFGIPANWRTLNRMNDGVLAAGYLPAEVWRAYPGALARGRIFANAPGNIIPVPAWVFSDTRAQDLRAAFTWLAGQSTPSTQIFFWNSWGHGARAFDFIGWLRAQALKLVKGVPFTFTLDPSFTSQLVAAYNNLNPGSGQGAAGSPDLNLTTTLPASFTATLDGHPLTATVTGDEWGDGTEYQWSFALARTDINALAAGGSHTLVIDYPSGPPNALDSVELLGFTTGTLPPDIDNQPVNSGPPGPAPGQ